MKFEDLKSATWKVNVFSKKDIDTRDVTEKTIRVFKGVEGVHLETVEARFSEYFQGDYRLIFTFNGKSYDLWFPSDGTIVQERDIMFTFRRK